MFCNNCGTKRETIEDKFCKNCGADLIKKNNNTDYLTKSEIIDGHQNVLRQSIFILKNNIHKNIQLITLVASPSV